MTTQESSSRRTGLSNRAVGALAVAVLLVVWVAANRESVAISFVVGSAELPLWVALSIAALLGALVGFLSARRRYRR